MRRRKGAFADRAGRDQRKRGGGSENAVPRNADRVKNGHGASKTEFVSSDGGGTRPIFGATMRPPGSPSVDRHIKNSQGVYGVSDRPSAPAASGGRTGARVPCARSVSPDYGSSCRTHRSARPRILWLAYGRADNSGSNAYALDRKYTRSTLERKGCKFSRLTR